MRFPSLRGVRFRVQSRILLLGLDYTGPLWVTGEFAFLPDNGKQLRFVKTYRIDGSCGKVVGSRQGNRVS